MPKISIVSNFKKIKLLPVFKNWWLFCCGDRDCITCPSYLSYFMKPPLPPTVSPIFLLLQFSYCVRNTFLVQWCSILTMSSFLAFIAISWKFVCRTESVQQRKHWVGHKNGQKTPFLWPTDDSFVTLTQEMAKNAQKKGDMDKIENHCTKKKLDWGKSYFSI